MVDGAAIIAVLGGALYSARHAFRIWTGRIKAEAQPSIWWPFGDAGWRAFIRAYPATIVGVFGFLVLAVSVIVGPEIDDPGSLVFAWIGLVALGGTALAILAALAIALFNRPQLLVPRRLREERGLLQ